MIDVRLLSADECRQRIAELVAVLIDCVHDGASVEFLASITEDDAAAYWTAAFDRVEAGRQVLAVAVDDDAVVGTVSLVVAPQQNQPHRGEISKLLVAPAARRKGVAAALMDAIEHAAHVRGRTLLVLDTVTGSDASRVYERRDWIAAGDIPDYALSPTGELASTTYYWKWLD